MIIEFLYGVLFPNINEFNNIKEKDKKEVDNKDKNNKCVQLELDFKEDNDSFDVYSELTRKELEERLKEADIKLKNYREKEIDNIELEKNYIKYKKAFEHICNVLDINPNLLLIK